MASSCTLPVVRGNKPAQDVFSLLVESTANTIDQFNIAKRGQPRQTQGKNDITPDRHRGFTWALGERTPGHPLFIPESRSGYDGGMWTEHNITPDELRKFHPDLTSISGSSDGGIAYVESQGHIGAVEVRVKTAMQHSPYFRMRHTITIIGEDEMANALRKELPLADPDELQR